MQKDLNKLAREIIEDNQYMTIASSDESGKAWVSPVAYAFDRDFNLYWVSFPDSQHQRNIKVNPHVVIAIYDSHQNWGEGVGVQIEAVVEQIKIQDITFAMNIYFSRKYPYGDVLGVFGKGLQELLKGKIYHFYKAIPKKVWYPDPNSDIDSRVEIDLQKV